MSAPQAAPTGDRVQLVADTDRLADRLAGASPAWYAAHPPGDRSRAQLLRALVLALARLGGRAGTGQPAGAEPPDLGAQALADQIRVLAGELAVAPRAAQVIAEALALVRATRDAL